MATLVLTAGLAPDIVLAPDYVLRVTALDPATGNTVSGVVISDVSLQVDTIPKDVETKPLPVPPPLFAYDVSA